MNNSIKYKYYDLIICQIGPPTDVFNKWIEKLNSLKLDYKIISVNKKQKHLISSKDYGRVDYIKIKKNYRIEEKSLRYAFDNYVSPHYFLTRGNDSPDDFELLYLLVREGQKDFINIQEEHMTKYSLLFKYNILNTEYSASSSYSYFSRRFLKSLLYKEELNNCKKLSSKKLNDRSLSRDLIWESIEVSYKNKNLKSSSIHLKGSNSKAPLYKKKILMMQILYNSKKKLLFFLFPIFIVMLFDLGLKNLVLLIFLYLLANLNLLFLKNKRYIKNSLGGIRNEL